MDCTPSAAFPDVRWQYLADGLVAAHADADRNIAAWCASYRCEGGVIHCQERCRECCSLTVNADFSEAWLLAQSLTAAQQERVHQVGTRLRHLLPQTHDLKGYLRLYRDQLGPCPLLNADGCCSCYEVRPLACRSLLSTRNRDWCGADIAALHPMEVQLFLASLDRRVVAYPSHYVAVTQDWCRTAEAAATARCGKAFGLTLTGNLPWLVYLQLEYGLGERFAEGYEKMAEFFAAERLHHGHAALLQPLLRDRTAQADSHATNQAFAKETEGSGGLTG